MRRIQTVGFKSHQERRREKTKRRNGRKVKSEGLGNRALQCKRLLPKKSLAATREIFRIRTNMNLKGNFKNDSKYKNDGVMCVACGLKEEVNTHGMVCSHNEDLRQRRDFSKNADLVQFFREVMSRREIISNRN